MKIILYGGMANNLYVVAKAINSLPGIECKFLRDRNDRFAFSQPSWEDCRATLTYGDVVQSSSWDWKLWDCWESENKWLKPDWLIDLGHQAQKHQIVSMLGEADLLLVCGVSATISAYESRSPYLIMPHGGDIRLAAGLVKTKPTKLMEHITGHRQDRMLNEAYKNALAVVTHGPLCIGGPLAKGVHAVEARLPSVNFSRLAIPVRPRDRKNQSDRRGHFNQQLRHVGCGDVIEDFVLFVPSRIDYFWKGQDRLVKALEKTKRGSFHVVFSGWGADYMDLKGKCGNISATFLPCALSKELLYSFYCSADIVVDQFILGDYGTAAQEAMSCGTPVLMWIDELEYLNDGRIPPPVLNASTQDEISGILDLISRGIVNYEDVGAKGKQWVLASHSPYTFANNIADFYNHRLSQERQST